MKGGARMQGSKRNAKKSWLYGRTGYSLRAECKYSIKRNKKYLNRKTRHTENIASGNAYRKLAKNKAWEYVS